MDDQSEVAQLRAERDHWRAMYDAAMAAAKAGIKAHHDRSAT